MAEVDLEKRRTTRILAGLALNAGAQMLGISTAHAAVSVDCPIYMFHGISQGGAAVDNIIRTNARAGRIPVSIKTLSEIILGEREIPNKPLFALTFDDGLLSQYQQAKPILDRYEAEATFFVMGTAWQGDGVHIYMTPDQIKHLAGLGYEIGSHTVNHTPLVTLRTRNYGTYLDEITQSRDQLAELVDDEITSFAYPNGSYNGAVASDIAELYKAAVSTQPGRIQTESIKYALRRVRA